MTQNELEQRLTNKTTVCKHLYRYTHNNITNGTLCVYLPQFETDQESEDAGMELEEGLISYYGKDSYLSFYKIQQFIPEEEQEEVFLNIIAHFRTKVKNFIATLCQQSLDEKTGYIFSFLPESLN